MNPVVCDPLFYRVFSIDGCRPGCLKLGFIDPHVEEISGADEHLVLQDWIEFDPCGLHFLVSHSVDVGNRAFRCLEMTLLRYGAWFEFGVGGEV